MAVSEKAKARVVILGGGFGGVFAAHHLDRLTRKDPRVEVTLISRDNFYLMTPLLFEASSGVLDPRHAVNPIRPMLKTARFVEAEVEAVDFDKRTVRARHGPGDEPWTFDYDHLVIALGGVSNRKLIPGSEHAITFKTMADALLVRNHVIDLCERAEVEGDPARRRELLTFVVIGGGLVGVELMGELHEFVTGLCDTYPRITPDDPKFILLDRGNHIVEEMPEDLARYAQDNFVRRGIDIRHNTRVPRIGPGLVYLPEGEPSASRTCSSLAPTGTWASIESEIR
jgi:NADH dehydrogenase